MDTTAIGNSVIFSNLPDFPSDRSKCSYTPPIPNTDSQQILLEAKIKSLLSRRVRITVIDGRVYQGTLYCYDADGNMVLTSVTRIMPDGTVRVSYSLMAPVHTVVKVELDETS